MMVVVGANEYILWPYHFRCGSHDSAAVVGSLWDEQVKLCCPDDLKDLFSTPKAQVEDSYLGCSNSVPAVN